MVATMAASSALSILEIAIRIAEEAKPSTMWSLMCTNRRLYAGITLYERSICASRIRAYSVEPMSDVLCTRDPSHRVFPRLSFETLGELERRTRRIASVVGDDFLSANTNVLQQCRSSYVAGMQRALQICDQIFDLGYCDSQRQAQVDYIKSLSVVDLAFLAEVAWIGSIGWVRQQDTRRSADVDFAAKTLAFEELVLRQGSMFIWGYALGDEQFRHHSENQIETVTAEIVEWECGAMDRLPSLRLTVIHAFMEKKRCSYDEFADKVASIVERAAHNSQPSDLAKKGGESDSQQT